MNIKISSLIKSLILSYVITLLILILLSFLLLKFQLSESVISIGITMSYVISCFTGGYVAGKMSSSRRFLYGLLLGTVYFIFLTLISIALNKGFQSNAGHFISVMLMCSLSGMLGGMLTNNR